MDGRGYRITALISLGRGRHRAWTVGTDWGGIVSKRGGPVRQRGGAAWRARVAVPIALSLAVGVGASANAAPARPAHASAPAVSLGVPVTDVAKIPFKKLNEPDRSHDTFKPTRTAWPVAATGSAALASPAAGASVGAKRTVTGTPVWVQAVDSKGRYTGPSGVGVRVLSQAQSAALGISGVVWTLSGSGNGSIRVGLDYGAFSQAGGGNFASRLGLVQLPACALTTPQAAECRRRTPLASTNDPKAQSVSTQLTLHASAGAPAATAASATSLTVLAATDSTGQEGGSGGEYASSALKPSGSWSAGGSSGSFTYSYPITLPGASSTLTPSVALAYDSGSVDAQTANTQAQSSWIGDGWTTQDSYVEQTYTPCDDSPEGSAGSVSTTDECYDGNILTLALNGSTTSLVYDSASSTFRLQDDNGSTVSHVTNSNNGSGTYNTDYWVVTERDGTQYYFGRNELPGWSSGLASTNSVDYERVYAAHSTDDPCYSATAASSYCVRAYKWHLDYVVDTHSEAMAYYYDQAVNSYGAYSGAATVGYVRDSYLDHIDYGFTTATGPYGTVPDKVVFSTSVRCVADSSTCGTAETSSNAASYPDVPFDLVCSSACTQYAPSFFSTVRLTAITTQQYSVSSGGYVGVDSYALTQTEPSTGDSTSATLFLSSIQRTAGDLSAGGSSTAITLPPVTFTGVGYENRVDTSAYPGLTRFRVTSVTTETGGQVGVTYGLPVACTASWAQTQTASTASADTKSCFPVYWTPSGNTAPLLDWFNKFAVVTVIEHDTTAGASSTSTAGSSDKETDYTYSGAAWHYDDNEVVKPQYRTYGQFRGYQSVTTTTGNATDGRTEQLDSYYQGMNGDYLSSTSTRAVSLSDSQGGTHTDLNQLAGKILESTAYLGYHGDIDHSTVSSYWVSAATATRARTGLPDLTANATSAAESWTRQRLTDGGTISWRYNETDTTYDATATDANFALPTFSYSHTVPVTAAYDRCTATTYAAANTSANLAGLPQQVESDSVACSGFTEGSVPSVPAAYNTLAAPASVSRPAQVLSATQSFYDDPTFSATQPTAPSVGNATMTRTAVTYASGAFTWRTTTKDSYDTYGRVLTSTDGNGNTTTAAYTVNTAGLTTASTLTNALSQTSSTTFDPTRGLALTSTDANGVVSTSQYDALGRPTSVWLNSRATGAAPSETYTYTVSNTSLSGVVAKRLLETLSYATTVTIEDSLGRTRQTQTDAVGGGGRLLTDQIYDSRGWVRKKSTAYWESGVSPAVDTAIDDPADGKVPNQDDYVYDGLGRLVYDYSENDANLVSTTTTVYNGDATTVIPPTGGVEQTTVTDPLGRTSQLDEYTARPTLTTPSSILTGVFYLTGGTKTATTYGYDGHGKQATTTDANSETWTSTYDVAGEVTAKSDPDAGTSTMLYDADGNLTQSTDALGNTLSYTYDALNRKTGQYNAAATAQVAGASGNQTAAWVYDNSNAVSGVTDAIGHITTEVSYSGASAYTKQYKAFNVFGESLGETYTVPSAEGALAGSYAFTHTYYTNTGLPDIDVYTAADGLPLEAVTHTYNSLDLPSVVSSNVAGYAQPTTYSAYGQVAQVTLGSGSNEAYVTNTYDLHTGNLETQGTTRSTATPATVDQESYYYDTAGNLTAQSDARLGSTSTVETQCFAYDTQDRLTTAWSDTAGTSPASGGGTGNCVTTTPPTSNSHATVGDGISSTSAYWNSYTYDATGDRTSQVQHSTTGGTDTTTAYAYYGNSAGQPHTLTSTTATGGSPATTNYTYDADGNTKTRTTSATGAQTLTWNPTGTLARIASTSASTSYVYDADGSVLLQKDPTTTTLYVGTEQITLTTATTALTGLRYYALPGGATAVRTGLTTNYTFEVSSDRHGTDTLQLDHTAQTPTWRQYDPYGNPRGATVTWSDNRGFLDQPTDAVTGLTSLGARYYDPSIGRFVSLDPLFEATDPLALNGYSYTSDNPVTSSDPGGLRAMGDASGSSCNWNGTCTTTASQGTGGDYVDVGGSVYVNTNNSHFQELADWGMAIAFQSSHAAGIVNVQRQEAMRSWLGLCTAHPDVCGPSMLAVLTAQVKALGGSDSIHSDTNALAVSAGGATAVLHGVDSSAGDDTAAQDYAAKIGLNSTVASLLKLGIASSMGWGMSKLGAVPSLDEGCGNSFTAATPVLMADGTSKPIDQVKVGDQIADAQPGAATGTKDEKHTVTAIHITYTDHDYTDVTVATGFGADITTATLRDPSSLKATGQSSATITGTAHHLYWDATTRTWTPADQLQPGDLLQTSDGHTALILALHDYTATTVTYNLTIDTLHTYYVVAGDTPVLVHNCDEGATIAQKIADHANGEAIRPDGDGTHFVRGVDTRALPEYVHGVIDGDVPNVVTRYLNNGRVGYWDPDKLSVVIEDGEGGTVFTPKGGLDWFNNVLR